MSQTQSKHFTKLQRNVPYFVLVAAIWTSTKNTWQVSKMGNTQPTGSGLSATWWQSLLHHCLRRSGCKRLGFNNWDLHQFVDLFNLLLISQNLSCWYSQSWPFASEEEAKEIGHTVGSSFKVPGGKCAAWEKMAKQKHDLMISYDQI